MGNYSLSGAASNDIAGIYRYGIKNFGLNPAQIYIEELEKFLVELSEREELSKDASTFAYNLKYYNYKAHVVFYVFNESQSIFVVRILGKRMNFIEHL